MGERFRLETQAGQETRDGRLTALHPGSVGVLDADGGVKPQVALRLDFARNAYLSLGLAQAAELGEVLRAHAARLAVKAG